MIGRRMRLGPMAARPSEEHANSKREMMRVQPRFLVCRLLKITDNMGQVIARVIVMRSDSIGDANSMRWTKLTR